MPIFIISGTELAVDETWSLGELVGGIARLHLPLHQAQLAGLRS